MYRHNASFHVLLCILDALIALLVITPLVVVYWKASWTLVSIYMFPTNKPRDLLVAFLVGNFGTSFFSLVQNWLQTTFDPERRKVAYLVAARVYTSVFSFFNICATSGCYTLIDVCFETMDRGLEWPVTGTALLFLVFTKTLRNLIIMDTDRDKPERYFRVDTRFRFSVSNEGQ